MKPWSSRPERVFLLVCGIFGPAFALATPPYDAPDEHRHFARAFLVAEGRFAPHGIGRDGSARVPASLLRLHAGLGREGAGRPCHHDLAGLAVLAEIPLEPGRRVAIDTRTPYGPLVYLPHALSIAVGRALGLSPLHLLRAARLGGLLAWCALVAFAIRLAPVGKWIFVVLALLPMAVFEASVVSADPVTIGAAWLFLAAVLHLALAPGVRVTGRAAAWLIALAAVLASVKPGYATLAAAALVIPVERFPQARARVGLGVALAAAVVVPTLLQALWVSQVGDGPPVPRADPARQLALIAADPLALAGRLASAWLANGRAYAMTFVGVLGILDVVFPRALYALYGAGLLAVALAREDRSALRPAVRVGAVALFVGNTALLMTLAYVAWNPPGAPALVGFGGRYLLPLAPLLLLAAPPQRWMPAASPLVVAILSSLGLLVALVTLLGRYYGAG